MSIVETALAKFRRDPVKTPESVANNPFRVASSLSGPAAPGEVEMAWQDAEPPPDAIALWATCRTARLFEDVDYGQWGLVLLDPASSAERTKQERVRRSREFRSDDIVLGAFLGDPEMLVFSPSELSERRLLIALPLDERTDWFGVGSGLGAFLEAYYAAGGEKFWERLARH